MMENYLQVLEDSMHKKLAVLQEIETLSRRQGELLSADPVDEEAFSDSLEEKGLLIDQLNGLDEGFEILYEKLRVQLQQEKEQYKPQIARIQQLITEVTEKSMSIQAQEARNHQAAEAFFARAEGEVQRGRRSSKAAMDYYKSMNHMHSVPPQFMDQKK